MKTLVLCSFKQALNKLALVTFVVANVSPAFAQSYGTSPTYIPLVPGPIANPALIMQAQANLNIYGPQGNSLGQLMPGSVFQTQMSSDPFQYVMNQPTLSYPAILGTAMQMQTPMGYMIPGTLEESAMLANGTTLPMNTNFYIPPADFSYQRIRTIGARSNGNDEDINRLFDEIILGGNSENPDEKFWNDDEDDDDYTSSGRSSDRKSYSLRDYRSGSDFYSQTMAKNEQRAEVRQSTYSPEPLAEQVVADALMSNSPFKILGPTCGCFDKGSRKCAFNTRGSGRNMFKGKRYNKKTRKWRYHYGLDITGAAGSPVIAVADGKIEILNTGNRGYGIHINMVHTGGFGTRYGHLSKVNVRNGQIVKKGQIIGFIGNTGASEGNHLHLETCKLGRGENRCNNGNVVDPRNFMPNGGGNPKQLNMSCTEAAAVGDAPAPAASSGASRAVRSGRAAR